MENKSNDQIIAHYERITDERLRIESGAIIIETKMILKAMPAA